MSLRLSCVLAPVLLFAAPGWAQDARVLRVGTSGDYAPFSVSGPEGPKGFDIAVAERFAEDQGWGVEFVTFRWPELLPDLSKHRFDVAMSGVTVRPERSVAARFTVPVVTSGALALVHEDSPYQDASDLRLAGTRVAVNAGGHLEQVARASFPRVTLLAIPDNAAVLTALASRQVDAAVTDDLEAAHWRSEVPGLRAIGPLTRDRKAYLVDPAQAGLARSLDAWLLARERDGTLEELREEWLPGSFPALATPMDSLLAALDERLDLMPLVAESKRREGLPVRDPEREARVQEAAVAAAREAAREADLPPLPERRVRALFAAQIEAAVAVQQAVLAGAAASGPASDLETELRPALLRLGERISMLLVRLPGPMDPGQVEGRTTEALDAPGLEPRHVAAIADAIAQLSLYRR
ncbi:MAG: transporter substrate-binding domain-containing protein [Myxococcota bacterium]